MNLRRVCREPEGDGELFLVGNATRIGFAAFLVMALFLGQAWNWPFYFLLGFAYAVYRLDRDRLYAYDYEASQMT